MIKASADFQRDPEMLMRLPAIMLLSLLKLYGGEAILQCNLDLTCTLNSLLLKGSI